ncbi:unnamed protein product [Gadus morhua 'NCC']
MSSPEFIVYSDSELEQVRRSYFEQKRMGTESVVVLSKELFCRLIRNTMCNMISIARATEDARYPTKPEVNAMAKRLVEYYPMVKDWEHVAKKMIKRLSNVKSPKKANPPAKKQRRECGEISTSDYDGDSSASTVILHRSPVRASTPVQDLDSSDECGSGDVLDSQKTQARHYKHSKRYAGPRSQTKLP